MCDVQVVVVWSMWIWVWCGLVVTCLLPMISGLPEPQPPSDLSPTINWLSRARAFYGALQNRLEYTVSNLMNVAEFTTAARSRIEDADFAAESARLAKAQVLQQTGTAMLAQANAQPQLALSLIR